MKRLSGRTRLLLATLVALLGAGAAGGIVLAEGDTAGTAAGPSGILARGPFKSVFSGTRGAAMIERLSSGKLVLRFDRNFTTRDAPDTFVYLVQYDLRSHHGNRGKYLMVAALKTAYGGQHYDLPVSAAKMLHYSVEVYCAGCDKTEGIAKLQPTALAGA